MAKGKPKETWTIEIKDQYTGTWHTDTTGEVIYDSKPRALTWAQRLHLIYPDVQLKHTVTDYELIQ